MTAQRTEPHEVLIGADIEAAGRELVELQRTIEDRLTTLTCRGLRNGQEAGLGRIVVVIDETAFFSALAAHELQVRRLLVLLISDVVDRGRVVEIVPNSVNKASSLALIPASLRDLLA